MSQKFGKYREVDNRYLNVPVKYITRVVGSNPGGKDKYREESYEEWLEWCKMNGELCKGQEFSRKSWEAVKAWEKNHGIDCSRKILVKKGVDKSLCIVDFYGKNKALVGWRNVDRFSIGMPTLCRIVRKGKKAYIEYRGKLICISDRDGWVF